MILRKFSECVEQDVDALLGSLALGVKNKWLVGKESARNGTKLSFALKYSIIDPGRVYPMHPSEHAEAMFILDGNGSVNNDKEEFKVKAGDIVLTRCGEWYSVTNLGKTELRTLCCIDMVSHQ